VRAVTTDSVGRATAVDGRSVTYVPGVDRIGHYESTLAPGNAVQSLDVDFDGMGVTKLTAAGLAPAETTWTYGADLRQTGTRLVSGSTDATLAYTRDADGVLTGVGPFTHERTGPDKSLSAIVDGAVRTEETVDNLADLKTRVLKVGASEKYRLELTPDATGRITGKREVTAAGDHTYAYAYNAMGELTEVRRDGVVVETYAYDLDGDRTSQGATYDSGGKLTSRGGTNYAFDADGFLTARGSDTFTYARRGELRSATVGGTTVSYAYDAVGRMVARIEGGATTQYIYGDPDYGYRVSAARAPDGTLDRYLYGPRGNLYAVLRGGQRFHVATDQVGSPRVVVAADGTVVKRLEYDTYGITTDLDPGFFLPFGYAGGLHDPVTGLVRFGLRDYEPQSGRFTARDPAMFAGSPRSLYGYANNSPASYRDPGGTASLNISGYFGPGGGATFYYDPSALWNWDKPLVTGLCVEFGVGAGAGVESDFLEQAPKEGSLSAFAEAAAKYGPGGVKVGGEFDLICGKWKGKIGGNLGPLQAGYGSDGPSAGLAADPISPEVDQSSDRIGLGNMALKTEGKVGFKGCLPPPPG
jgi:RHS repeat-associated protein